MYFVFKEQELLYELSCDFNINPLILMLLSIYLPIVLSYLYIYKDAILYKENTPTLKDIYFNFPSAIVTLVATNPLFFIVLMFIILIIKIFS